MHPILQGGNSLTSSGSQTGCLENFQSIHQFLPPQKDTFTVHHVFLPLHLVHFLSIVATNKAVTTYKNRSITCTQPNCTQINVPRQCVNYSHTKLLTTGLYYNSEKVKVCSSLHPVYTHDLCHNHSIMHDIFSRLMNSCHYSRKRLRVDLSVLLVNLT